MLFERAPPAAKCIKLSAKRDMTDFDIELLQAIQQQTAQAEFAQTFLNNGASDAQISSGLINRHSPVPVTSCVSSQGRALVYNGP